MVSAWLFAHSLIQPFLGIHPHHHLFLRGAKGNGSICSYIFLTILCSTLYSYTYSRLAVNGSTDYDSDPFPPPNDDTTPSLQTVTTPVYRSGSLSIEYLTVPFNVVFVIVAVLLWLQNEMGVTIF